MTHYVHFFDDAQELDLDMLGGKFASLASLTRAGMAVPPGFTVTTTSYDMFLDESGIRPFITKLLDGLNPDDTVQVDNVSEKIRDAICSKPVPTVVREETIRAYEALQARFDTPTQVAVRSSATAEDLPGASFAGQQDTYLGLLGVKAVTEHIRQCWASLYTSRAITYRMRNQIPNDTLSMAVAVQKMANSRVSGVAMTMDPTNGDRSKIVIDSSWGVGEMVVSGSVTPDNFVLDKVTLTTVNQTIGTKHAQLLHDPETNSLVERDVPVNQRQAPSLTDTQLKSIGELAKRAERHYGCPQDIEWTIDNDLPEDSNLLLLQSRPETVFSSQATTTSATKSPSASSATTGNSFMSGITASILGNAQN